MITCFDTSLLRITKTRTYIIQSIKNSLYPSQVQRAVLEKQHKQTYSKTNLLTVLLLTSLRAGVPHIL